MLNESIAVWSHVAIGIRRSGSYCGDSEYFLTRIDLRAAEKLPRDELVRQHGEEVADWIKSGAAEPLYRFDGTILHRSW